jgi:hypothetical protein
MFINVFRSHPRIMEAAIKKLEWVAGAKKCGKKACLYLAL